MSACLLGVACRYDGGHRYVQAIGEHPDIIPVPICPEQLGGLATPRPCAWFSGGDGRAVLHGAARVVDATGADVTEAFLRGARQVCRIAELIGTTAAVLKEGSPSCGHQRVWIDHERRAGLGVTAAMLMERGIHVLSEEEIDGE